MLKPKFIPDDQFWSNNGILFPEVKVSGTHYDWSNYNKLEDLMQNCTLFVSCEPCIMCAYALNLIHISKVYFGSFNKFFWPEI